MQVPNLSLQSLPSTACWLKRLSMDLQASASFPVVVLSRNRKLFSPLAAPDVILSILGTFTWTLFFAMLLFFFKYVSLEGFDKLPELLSIGISTIRSISTLSRIHSSASSRAPMFAETLEDTMKREMDSSLWLSLGVRIYNLGEGEDREELAAVGMSIVNGHRDNEWGSWKLVEEGTVIEGSVSLVYLSKNRVEENLKSLALLICLFCFLWWTPSVRP